MEGKRRFNIRVYGLLINDQNEVLVTDEYRFGMKFTKFPGGGLEFGEGTVDCLKRECMEELFQEVQVTKHFYTTDFFQHSAFNNHHQLISIYYFIEPVGGLQFTVTKEKYDFEELKDEAQSFRWLSLHNISADEFKFPVDKCVAEMLSKEFKNK